MQQVGGSFEMNRTVGQIINPLIVSKARKKNSQRSLFIYLYSELTRCVPFSYFHSWESTEVYNRMTCLLVSFHRSIQAHTHTHKSSTSPCVTYSVGRYSFQLKGSLCLSVNSPVRPSTTIFFLATMRLGMVVFILFRDRDTRLLGTANQRASKSDAGLCNNGCCSTFGGSTPPMPAN
jgi:hypothetical protein